MHSLATQLSHSLRASGLPLRKESYTTWLYVGLAILVAVLTVWGMWHAGTPRVGP